MLIPYAYSIKDRRGVIIVSEEPNVRDQWIKAGLKVTSLYTLPQISGAVRAVFDMPRNQDQLPA